MIYPVPDPGSSSWECISPAGFTTRSTWPNAVPALAREGYSWGVISVRDTLGSLLWPGALPLFARIGALGFGRSLRP